MMKASEGGGFSGGGNSISAGGAHWNPNNTTVGSKNTKMDTYIENLVVNQLKANKIWSEIGDVYLLKVQNLYARGGASNTEYNVGDRISELLSKVSNLQNKINNSSSSTTP